VIDFLERETGLEPVTSSLGSWHSTTELLPPGGERLGFHFIRSARDWNYFFAVGGALGCSSA
jgi:hypothetical protein